MPVVLSPSSTMLLALRAGSANAIFVNDPTPSVFDDRVANLYLGPTLTARLRARLTQAA